MLSFSNLPTSELIEESSQHMNRLKQRFSESQEARQRHEAKAIEVRYSVELLIHLNLSLIFRKIAELWTT